MSAWHAQYFEENAGTGPSDCSSIAPTTLALPTEFTDGHEALPQCGVEDDGIEVGGAAGRGSFAPTRRVTEHWVCLAAGEIGRSSCGGSRSPRGGVEFLERGLDVTPSRRRPCHMTTDDLGVLAITDRLLDVPPRRACPSSWEGRSSRLAAPSWRKQLEETGYEGLAAALGVETTVDVDQPEEPLRRSVGVLAAGRRQGAITWRRSHGMRPSTS